MKERPIQRLSNASKAAVSESATTPVTFRTEGTKRKRLDAIAEVKGRNRNWVINEALDNYLELQEWHAEHIRKGRAASDAGPTYSTEEVRAIMAEHHEHRKAKG